MIRRLFLILFLLIQIFTVSAQFYNGHQMTFGKNRVQYHDYIWQFYRYDRFDTYFYKDGKEIAIQAANRIKKLLPEIEETFEYHFDKRMIFIIYTRLTSFRQSNIGLVTDNDQTNIGGTTKIIDNKVFLYFEGNWAEFEKQIRKALTQIILSDLMYGGSIKDKVANSTLLNIPTWYSEGLISYISEDWNAKIDDHVKDGILSGRYKKFNHLRGEDAVYAGHSIWKYIVDTYGKSVIPNIVYMTRVNKNTESGFIYVLGYPIKDLAAQWYEFFSEKYKQEEAQRSFPEMNEVKIKPKKETTYNHVKISPDGKYIAYSTNMLGQYKIWIYNTETQKRKLILKKESKLEQIIDYSYPMLAWHPSGQFLSMIIEKNGYMEIVNLVFDKTQKDFKKLKKIESKRMFSFDKVFDFSYSSDGLKYVISALHKGKVDIFVYIIASNITEQITNDMADDMNPRFVNNSKNIVFSSNRLSDTLKNDDNLEPQLMPTSDLFVYDFIRRSPVLKRLSLTHYNNETFPEEIGKDNYTFLTDESGINNISKVASDSVISFIDTTTHYRYFTITEPVTNYPRYIHEYHPIPQLKSMSELLFQKGKYHIYENPYNTDRRLSNKKSPLTSFKIKQNKKFAQVDSLTASKIKAKVKEQEEMKNEIQKKFVHPDSAKIDINNYIFEKERIHIYPKSFADSLIIKKEDKDTLALPPQRIYKTVFYTSYFVSQIDFSFLNNAYQAFTGGQVYFSPGMNVFFKLGTQDLFEDYRITGGYKPSINFDSNEYLLSLEDLKTRWDKQYMFHRQVFLTSTDEDLIKVKTNNYYYILKYPFSQTASFRGTFNVRTDNIDTLAYESTSLAAPPGKQIWGGLKLEYVIDNARKIDLNIYEGVRSKIFAEYYRTMDKEGKNLYIVGADFRYYKRLHRNLIWASRFACSSSFGSAQLIYYLGGVDNWINLSSKTPTFNNSIRIDPDRNYVYQTVATNMRGFTQNIRNGNNFALINTEIRWPIIKYFVNRPMNSDFLSTFQVIGFFDVGSAWNGRSPFDKKSAYNTNIVESYPITIIVNAQRSPLVAGYGIGFRAKLLGYFVRIDWAKGIENKVSLPRIIYFSLNMDF